MFGALPVCAKMAAIMTMREILFCLAATCQMVSFAAQAGNLDERADTTQARSVWINAGFLSRHFERNKGLKENNYGLGVQVALSPTDSVIGGEFRNSNDACSRYLAWIWQPYAIGSVRFGLLAGAIDGYPKMKSGGWFPMVIPVVSFEYKVVGVNFTLVPGYKDRLDGAVAMQFKLRALTF